MDIRAIQKYLLKHRIDGWLIYDFDGMNTIALSLLGLGGRMLTRRWFYFIPKQGIPTLLLHQIERENFPPVEGEVQTYIGWMDMEEKLKGVLGKSKRIAMEYSPRGSIPYVSRVDGGILDLVRDLGVEVISSSNLVQYFQARLTDEQLQSHISAARKLSEVMGNAFKFIREKIHQQGETDEYEVQQFITDQFRQKGLVAEHPPIVAVNENSANPHYEPTEEVHEGIRKGDFVLIDMWAKEARAEAVYADITWVGYVGTSVPEKYKRIFDIVARGRDLALEFLRETAAKGELTQGWRVDKLVRDFITDQGYGQYFIHRTGHSIGSDVHGGGVNIDNLETKDLRDIIPGVAFSIEPGIYLEDFGVRSEIDVYYNEEGPQVYTPIQKEIIPILGEGWSI